MWEGTGSTKALRELVKLVNKDLEAAYPKHSFEEFFAQLMTSSAVCATE
jgi:hypothetical protein